MRFMVVTRDVSQLEMSSLNSENLKSSLMSVMFETSQPPTGPYFSSAAVALSSYSATAIFSSALTPKTLLMEARRRWLVGGPGLLAARSTGSHCGETATGWLASDSLLAALGWATCEVKAAWKTAATPTRRSAQTFIFADFLVLLVQSVGTVNVPDLLY